MRACVRMRFNFSLTVKEFTESGPQVGTFFREISPLLARPLTD